MAIRSATRSKKIVLIALQRKVAAIGALAVAFAIVGGFALTPGNTLPVEGASTCHPYINSVSRIEAQNPQRIVIDGGCLGFHAPYDGDSAFLVISDVSEDWNAGCNGQSADPVNCNNNIIHLDVTRWTNDRIVVDGFTGAYNSYAANVGHGLADGDRIAIGVWNPQNGNGLLLPPDNSFLDRNNRVPSYTTTVGGNCSPVVDRVSRIQPGGSPQQITVEGRCFGAMSPTSNNTVYLELHDATQGDWAAGYGGDCLGLTVKSWSHRRIVFSGPVYVCGAAQTINAGDEMLVSVWNAQSNPAACADPLDSSSPAQCPDGPSTIATIAH